METISDVIAKTEHKSLYAFMGVIDPDHKIAWSRYLIETWNRLSLEEQRRLYLYCLYRKWRGERKKSVQVMTTILPRDKTVVNTCHRF